MKASSSNARSEPEYGAALVLALRHAHPKLSKRKLAKLMGVSRKHLDTLESMQKGELSFPLQLWLESKLDPVVVQDLRKRYQPRPAPYWLAHLGAKR